MRLAIIADIHGNADALDAVLRDAHQQGAERVIVNGDVVNRGPDSVEVMTRLLAEPGVRFTLGNHDDLLRLWQTRSATLPADWFDDPFWGATAWSTEQLDRAGLLHVPQDWPHTLVLDEPGLPRVLIAHGTSEHYREGLSERTRPERVTALRQAADGSVYDVLIGSHIHRPAHSTTAGAVVMNTGAVGFPANGDPRAQYLLLTATLTGWDAEFRAVPYDRSGVIGRFQTSGLLGTGLSATIFLEELLSARSLYTPYWEWTEVGSLQRTPETWNRFLNGQLTPLY
ncbi:metallophosphoesterase family protein [Deinococcus sp. KSM4-11]|uniref:metallophosphoesterase family protein n=1 Tax=Deinococcus sp. KSM4-11 TaxID=2568654 RepID=UPI0010A2D7B5|nr:metallophosphoesterase family protein [Deinococcus sp. KSM4-11]THF88126.1 metallophosphoesterase family protein [Deinococcus sp. KSM4-11]